MNRVYTFILCLIRPFFCLFYPYRVSGRENRPEGAAIVCANHTSLIDPIYLAIAFGSKHQLRFMAKKELSKVPLVGWILGKAGIFYVDRNHNDIDAIRTAMKALKDGSKIMMFPEGTRVAEDEAVAAKTGSVRLAVKLGVPIVPVYVPGNKKLFRRLHVVIGEPYFIERETELNSDELAAELMSKIAALKAVS